MIVIDEQKLRARLCAVCVRERERDTRVISNSDFTEFTCFQQHDETQIDRAVRKRIRYGSLAKFFMHALSSFVRMFDLFLILRVRVVCVHHVLASNV